MKFFKRILILCLFASLTLGGIVSAQNNNSSVSVKDAGDDPIVSEAFLGDDLLAVLDTLSTGTGINIMYPNTIQGIVTCNLDKIPLSKALEIVLAATLFKAEKRGSYYVITEPVIGQKRFQVSGSMGIANVKLEGLPGEVYTDEAGYYTASVAAGFYGKVQPVREGYKFNPSYIIYNNLKSDRKKQDYKAAEVSPEQAVGNELKDPAVTEEFMGDDLLAVLDVLAEQTKINIMYDESIEGFITCHLNKVPLSKTLEIITSPTNYIVKKMDDYYLVASPELDDFKNKISSKEITISGNFGVVGVILKGFQGNFSLGPDGSYRITVPSGWSGKIVPQKEGHEFSPQYKEYSNISSDLTNQNYIAAPIMCIISGTTAIPGVEMMGLPDHVVTGPDGSYSVIVPYSFSGTVRPKKEGFDFQPASMIYQNVKTDKNNQDYKGTPIVYTISGTTGIDGVRLEGLPGNPVTDRNGSYRINVSYGWSGVVIPQMSGYSFEPASRTYSNIAESYHSENYVAEIIKYQISGIIVSDKGEPVEGVVIESSGNAPVMTDSEGRYLLEVYHSSYGMIKPVGEKYTFSPAYIPYSPINRDIPNQNFKAQIRMLTISDSLKFKDKPLPGINVTANPGNIKSITDNRGQYSIQVPYGWSGDIFFTKPGLMADPQSYQNVTTDIINGIPVPPTNVMGMSVTPQSNSFQSQMGRSVGRKILFVPSGDIDPKDITETKEDILVMAEVLDERFREPRLIEGVLRDFGDFFGRDNQQTEALYIQGYGVIFMMEVDYQFSSLSQPETEVETKTSSDIDETWEQARQRVLSQETGYGAKSSAGNYERQMVNILKTELIRTLKYAANIRNIKPDEWVILSVSGQPRLFIGGGYGGGGYGNYGYGGYGGYGNQYGGGYGAGAMVEGRSGMTGYGGGIIGGYGKYSDSLFSPLPSDVMTIRVLKSDVDEFSSGMIEFEQFREKVKILMN